MSSATSGAQHSRSSFGTLTPSGRYLLEHRYLERLVNGSYEAPDRLFRRVAHNLAGVERAFAPKLPDAAIERRAEVFYQAMASRRFLPNAPTLLGAGRSLQQLMACFVLPIGDSLDEIFDAVRMAAVVHGRGGGTGFDFSAIRPRGSPVATGGQANGPVAYLRVFDTETDVVKAGGTGWGANMGVLRCDHPDIFEFVHSKSGGHGLRNFNLSVGVLDAFMTAVTEDQAWPLRHPPDSAVSATVPARQLFDTMCDQAWRTGDPGLLFLDRINRDNPAPWLGQLAATNPCGEAPLLPYESCCLGGINVAACYHPELGMRWDVLRETAHTAVRMLDNVIEACAYPFDEIRDATRATRKIGIGVMGFADLLVELGLPYESQEAVTFASRLMREINEHTHKASAELGRERGCFPAAAAQVAGETGARRNATTTSNAPNSTISAIAGCSAGVEPLFAVGFERQLANGRRLHEVQRGFLSRMRERGLLTEQAVARAVCHGSVQEDPAVPAELKALFKTATEISPPAHVRMQAAFQEFTDLSVSKTVNLPRAATAGDVAEVFRLAHESRCKGVTVFREGCRDEQFLVAGLTTTTGEPADCAICT